jgi:hypothetical protein
MPAPFVAELDHAGHVIVTGHAVVGHRRQQPSAVTASGGIRLAASCKRGVAAVPPVTRSPARRTARISESPGDVEADTVTQLC